MSTIIRILLYLVLQLLGSVLAVNLIESILGIQLQMTNKMLIEIAVWVLIVSGVTYLSDLGGFIVLILVAGVVLLNFTKNIDQPTFVLGTAAMSYLISLFIFKFFKLWDIAQKSLGEKT